MQNFLFRNRRDGTFAETGAVAGVAYDNSGSATGAMGADAAWYLNDDDLAVAVGNFANEMTSFYVAQAGSGQFTGNRWVRLVLEDEGGNRDAIGAVVELRAGGVTQRQRVAPSRSYLSQVELPLTFGLGKDGIEEIRVTWPDGSQQDWPGVKPGRTYRLTRAGIEAIRPAR